MASEDFDRGSSRGEAPLMRLFAIAATIVIIYAAGSLALEVLVL